MKQIFRNLKNRNAQAPLRPAIGKATEGQAMLLLVMVIGSIMLGISTIVGMISIQKIKTATEITDSTKAIYAADSGLEWWYYKTRSTNPDAENTPPFEMTNNSDFSVDDSISGVVKSIGHSSKSYRAFGLFLDAGE